MYTVRTNITFPKELLLEVDKIAGSGRRSAFLAESARKYLAHLKFAKVARKSFGILDHRTYPHFATSGKVRSYIRSFRKNNDTRFK